MASHFFYMVIPIGRLRLPFVSCLSVSLSRREKPTNYSSDRSSGIGKYVIEDFMMESDELPTLEPKKILCVGLVCVDLIQTCANFPVEDSDQRCLEQRWQRGGNASNNCTVLSHLGAPCEFFGTVSKGVFADYVEKDFREHNITCDNCIVHEACDFPLSTVIINQSNGSRTIIHSNRNLPELSAEDFYKLDLSKYCWIHFEGRRNVTSVCAMMKRVHHWNDEERQENVPRTKLSVELEKANRTQLLDLIPLCDVSFVGKDFATSQAYHTMSDTIRHLKPYISPGCELVCAWGDRGAMGISKDGKIVQSIAFSPNEIIDTLAAGDTFVAATIFNLVNGLSLQESIKFGCQLAGAKVGIQGFKDLRLICDQLRGVR